MNPPQHRMDGRQDAEHERRPSDPTHRHQPQHEQGQTKAERSLGLGIAEDEQCVVGANHVGAAPGGKHPDGDRRHGRAADAVGDHGERRRIHGPHQTGQKGADGGLGNSRLQQGGHDLEGKGGHSGKDDADRIVPRILDQPGQKPGIGDHVGPYRRDPPKNGADQGGDHQDKHAWIDGVLPVRHGKIQNNRVRE
ncbi:MAG: hypothetical protein H7840_07560 [Alphaproteobacteria bacterium]